MGSAATGPAAVERQIFKGAARPHYFMVLGLILGALFAPIILEGLKFLIDLCLKFLHLLTFLFLVIGCSFVLTGEAKAAATFPDGALTAYFDAHSGTDGLLLDAVNYDRTALYAHTNCNSTVDSEIYATSTDFLDSENAISNELWQMQKISANEQVRWTKSAANTHCSYSLTYLPFYSTSTVNTVSVSNQDNMSFDQARILIDTLTLFGAIFAFLGFIWLFR